MKAAKISAELQRCRPYWLPQVFPQGVIRHGVLYVGDATGSAGKSFPIPLNGNQRYLIDFAGGFKGDDLDLFAAGKGLSIPDAMQEAARFLGLEDGNSKNAFSRSAFAKVAKVSKVDGNNPRTEAVRRIWRESLLAAGTIVETYLSGRAITLLPPPISLRFCPRLWHRESKRWFPAMVSAVQGADGRLAAVHRTYLQYDGSRKAPVELSKKSFGPVAGGAVRLAKVQSSLQVSEGIETALAAMQATGQPTWAALSTSGLKALVLPPEIHSVTILADGDEPGETAARIAAERWFCEGREVRIARPPRGHDFADVLAGTATAKIRNATI